MRDTGRDFADVLAEAQQLGYAEADPAFDIDGVDAAHKLALLSAVAFGSRVDFAGVYTEGISKITAMDIEYAEELGYRIKLLGIAEMNHDGIHQRVHPAMVPAEAPIAAVEGVFNGVVTEGDFVGTTVLEGRGAGAGPTASAVVADLVDIACGRHAPTFGVPAEALCAPDGDRQAGRLRRCCRDAARRRNIVRIGVAAQPRARRRGTGGADHP
jgi:homoserine dehydrogenase